jgi:hypothetical protein
MRIRRPAIIITAILALGVAAAAVSGSQIAAAARHAPSARVEVSVVDNGPNTMYHG